MFVTSQSIYAGDGVFHPEFPRVGAFGYQGLQLDGRPCTKGRITFHTPMLYALGFIGLFTIGGLSGLFLATMAVDMHVHGTYFVIAHFHYIMVGGMVIGVPRRHPLLVAEDQRTHVHTRNSRQFSAAVIFIGFNLTFLPQFVLGGLGMPRRYPSYPAEVAGVPRALDGGRVGAGGWLRASRSVT